MSHIDDKHRALARQGMDMGKARGPEKNAGYGGRVRRYERGNIYWHPATGAHEVHGAILKAYLAQGGPGQNPKTGKRQLGFPTNDEYRTRDGKFPRSSFEWGSITWTSGTQGGVVHGTLHGYWMLAQEEFGPMGHPVSEHVAGAGGEAVFFERGCIYSGRASGGLPLHCELALPRLGQPQVTALEAGRLRLHAAIAVNAPPRRFRGSTTTLRRAMATTWRRKLGLRVTASPKSSPIILRLKGTTASARGGSWNLSNASPLADRTLYDIVLLTPGRKPVVLAPHAVYARKSWQSFGLVHATDLHVSRRLESFRGKLSGTSGKDHYVNYNDGVRQMIRYANQRYRKGELDAILATGDLIDYIFERDDNQLGDGNWGFFERLLRGQVRTPDGKKGEELLVPIFMSGGNHDYRMHPYDLLFSIDARMWPDPTVKNFKSHNLTEAEAKRIQGGKKRKVGKDGALKMVAIDKHNPVYFRRMVNDASYIVRLGKHRIVMIDSRWDAGMLTGTWDAIKTKAGFGSSDERNFAAGNPNSAGFTAGDVALVRRVLSETRRGGIVIVGVHAPPLNTAGNEYPHFFRETERPHADKKAIEQFLLRRAGFVGTHVQQLQAGAPPQIRYPRGWFDEGVRYFKKGSKKGLDYGIAKGKIDEFLKLCTGHGAPRAVDMVLSGHVHKNVEYRVEWNDKDKFLFFSDFYTENPKSYYPTGSPDGRLYIEVTPDARPNARPRPVPMREHRGASRGASHQLVRVPPYADPLDSTPRPATWWKRHRPLLLQTASVGPLDSWQRRDSKNQKPSPSFRGFREIKVERDVVVSVDYVRLDDLAGRRSRPSVRVPATRGRSGKSSKSRKNATRKTTSRRDSRTRRDHRTRRD